MTETTAAPTTAHRNEVLLVGTLQQPPAERELGDGAVVVTFRLDVVRDIDGPGRDSFDCSTRAARVRRAAAAWSPGDVVEVSGTLRRRFYRSGSGSRPFVVVDVERARRLPSLTRRRTRG